MAADVIDDATGDLYLEKRSHKNNSDHDVVIKSNYIKTLKPFQIHGLRFLYDKYLKGGGAILNDDDSLGKTVQCVLFLFALYFNNGNLQQSLIICEKNKQHHWLYHFDKWTTLKANLSTQDFSQSAVVIASSNDYEIVNNRKWNIIIIDNVDPITFVKHIQNANYAFKIWLADKNLKDDIKKMHKIFQWISNNKTGSLKSFESTIFANIKNNSSAIDSWKQRQYLNLFCHKYILRRTIHDVANQLPLVDIENYRKQFDSWLKSFNDSVENTSELTNSSVIVDDNLKSAEVCISEDEISSESSPSLLNLTLKSNDVECHKRRKGKDDTGLLVKRSKINVTIKSMSPEKAMPSIKIENHSENNVVVEKTHIECENSSLSANKSSPPKTSTQLITDRKNASTNKTKNNLLTERVDIFDNIDQRIKHETESNQSLPKFHLLDSFLSGNNKSVKTDPEITSKDEDNVVQLSNTIDNSERITFKLLDRFFS